MSLLDLPGVREEDSTAVSLSARCWNLREDDLPVPNRGMRRIRLVVTLDDEGEYEPWYEDLGPAENIDALPIGIPCGYYTSNGKRESVMSVGQALEEADILRGSPLPESTIEYIETAPLTFPDDIDKAIHEGIARRAHRSTFGPKGQVVR